MLFEMITSYTDVDTNREVKDIKKISSRYFSGNFLFDFVTIVPLSFLYRFELSRLLISIKCLRLIKLKNFLDIKSLMKQVKGVYQIQLDKDCANDEIGNDINVDRNKII